MACSLPTIDLDALAHNATLAREQAYAPYSGFAVGAAVLAQDGKIYRGCNLENASYGATVCAERVALFSAIAAGSRKIYALAVIADTSTPVAPCGICRQVAFEFANDLTMPVRLLNIGGQWCDTTIGELLPGAFSSTMLLQR